MKFTWCDKFTRALEKVPDEQFVVLVRAILAYGSDGVEPELEFPLDAIFESFREDIDYSHNRRQSGNKGGKARSGGDSEEAWKQPETASKLSATAWKQPETASKLSATASKQSETASKLSATASNPSKQACKQASNTSNTSNTSKKEGRMKRPTLQEVEAEIEARGYHVDARAFIAYYDSNGWKVGKNPMKSWKSALTTWERRDSGKAVASDADFSRFG